MINQNQTNPQAQKAFRVSVGVTIAVFAAALASLNLVIINFEVNEAVWQPSLWLFAMILVVSASLSSVYLCRNGRHILGIQILGGGLLLASLLVTFVREGRSAMISLVIMALIIFVSTQTLPDTKTIRLITFSVIVGVLNVLLDLWLPIERIAPPDFRSTIIIGAVALLLAAFAVFQYKTFNLRTKLLVLFISIPATIIAIVSSFLILTITKNLDQTFSPINSSITPVLAIISIALMITSLLAIFVSRSIAEPVVSLTRSAQKVADGDFNTKAEITTQDEIGVLAATFNKMTVQLKSLVGSLEARVSERTEGLILAAEVGGLVAQIRDLDELLINAVELIRSHFDLYYTQVYLVDKKNKKLLLRAGTGEVGKELVQSRFSLPLGPGSINSTAVFNKKPIIVANTTQSVVFRPNILLPETRSELAIPLMVGNLVVGVLDLQSDQANALSIETLPTFEALASQLAVAIENASLFAEVARTRTEIETQARRLVREGWDNSLDGVHSSEHIGFCYSEGRFYPLINPLEKEENGRFLSASITAVGEPIGMIQLEGNPDQSWTLAELELVNLVAKRVGQQVENLRLLTDAERYREEAENASRRLIRDGWSNFQEQSDISGYLYNQKEVTSLQKTDATTNKNEHLMRPLTIQGEIIGMLEVGGIREDDEEATALLTAVSNQLSAHIDSLRLAAQTERALGETAVQAERLAQLNQMATALGAANSREELFAVIPQHMGNIITYDNLAITLVEPDGHTINTFMLNNESAPTLILTASLEKGSAIHQVIEQQKAINMPNLHKADYSEADEMLKYGLQSGLMIPLLTARGPLGALSAGSKSVAAFTVQDENIMQQLAPLLASTIENQSLFAEAQKQAEKERLVNVISQKIQGTVTVESALETMVQELGQALKVQYTQVKLKASNIDQTGNGRSNDSHT